MGCGDRRLQRRMASVTTQPQPLISSRLRLYRLTDSPNVSTPGGLLAAVLMAEVLLGVGTSACDVGVLDLETGVVDFSF